MHYSAQESLQYFLAGYAPLREDGTIDFEALAGEFLVGGCDPQTVKEMYDGLPESYKRDQPRSTEVGQN